MCSTKHKSSSSKQTYFTDSIQSEVHDSKVQVSRITSFHQSIRTVHTNNTKVTFLLVSLILDNPRQHIYDHPCSMSSTLNKMVIIQGCMRGFSSKLFYIYLISDKCCCYNIFQLVC